MAKWPYLHPLSLCEIQQRKYCNKPAERERESLVRDALRYSVPNLLGWKQVD